MLKILLFLVKLMLLGALGGLIFTGCTTPGDENNTVSGLEGIWYEQEDFGGILEISGNTMTYTSGEYTFDITYTTKKSAGKTIEIIPDDEFWVYIDILYDPEEEILTDHDLPHTDGDGGYHLHTFKKTEYVAPPPPVYGERVDNSDPDAPKEFADYTVKSLSLQVFEPYRDNGDMAPEPPKMGWYEYELTIDDDGTGTIVSDFCKEIPFDESCQEALKEFLTGSELASINGLDIWTEEMPEDTQRYELMIEFADGSVLYSRANGADVPIAWSFDGRELHKLLFESFLDAGYNISTGEFHSTNPMKRIGRPGEQTSSWTITSSLERIERQGTAYDYDVHSEYPVFTYEGDVPDALMETLSALTEQFKAKSEQDVEEQDALMASATKSDRDKNDRWYAYSFYCPEWIKSNDLLVHMFVSEGHANSLGLGQYEYGYYPNFRYNFDPNTGEILSAADFFNDAEALTDVVIERLCETFSGQEYVNYYRSEENRELLTDALNRPENEGGIGVSPEYASLDLFFDRLKDEDGHSRYPYQIHLYYDELQDLLNEKYVSVW